MSNSVPPAIMHASRNEVNLNLEVIEGHLPLDLQGHVFVVAPVGYLDDIADPIKKTISKEKSSDSLLNGDGMIYRIDFDKPGTARIKSCLVKTPDYYADLATYDSNTKYRKYAFKNHGISRFSPKLGIRNQLNTAFLTMKFSKDSQERLLVAYDAGRPYEIDTETLEVITPAGTNEEWKGELDQVYWFKKSPFKSILTTAHLAFDFKGEGTMFTVNYGRSPLNLLLTIPLINNLLNLNYENTKVALKTLIVFFVALCIWQTKNLILIETQFLTGFLCLVLLGMILVKKHNFFHGILPDFTNVVSWDGQSKLEHWSLMLEDSDGNLNSVKIEQTIHQIGVTEDYIVIMDTAFVAGATQLLNNTKQWLRKLLQRNPIANSIVYIVRRSELKKGQKYALAKKIIIPFEAAHFLVDYANPNNQITIHVAHLNGMQVADWIRKCDISQIKQEPIKPYLRGMQHNETDLGRVGRYVVCGKTGALLTSQVLAHAQCTWAVDLYTYQDRYPDGETVPHLKQIYWASFGLWTDLMTQYIYNAYRDYEYRLISLTEILELARQGQPAALFRLDTESLTIGDYYNFPTSTMALSPQFIPRGDEALPTEGYLSCIVFAGTQSQIWIFDGSNLKQGPICKLAHEGLDMGFTLHTVWLRSISSRQSDYNVPVREDYQPLVSQNNQQIQELFNQEVYPHFPE